MNYNQLEKKMINWECQKAIFLLSEAQKLGIDTSSYGEIGVNPNSGYTYLRVEDYNFSLYMPINCELKKTDIYVLHTDFEDGTETELRLENGTTLEDLDKWANNLINDSEVD